jgi:DNA-directed RNA polymerase subunit RPC12/RpoP
VLLPDTLRVGNQPSRAVIAKAFITTSATYMYHRCAECGRRLKYKPGAWIATTGERFTTCRSCGYENLSLWEKVAENLAADGYDMSVIEGVLDMPQCLGDGTELQVSRDFTKVFCYVCGREWDRFEFEDIMNGPLSPQLAGAIPIKTDNSKLARRLDALLQENDIDAGTPFLVMEAIEIGSDKDVSFGKGFIAAIKKGVEEGKSGSKASERPVEPTHYLAIYADSLAHYVWDGQSMTVNEVLFDDFFSDPHAVIELPFSVRPIVKSLVKPAVGLLAALRAIHIANSRPYSPELYGTAARDAELKQSAVPAPDPTSFVESLRSLAELKSSGFLTEAEFQTAKAKLLEGN